MKYVKIVSRPDEWFDNGTEVFEAHAGGYNGYNKPFKRITVDEYKIWEKAGHILAFGLRKGHWMTELCPLEEFEVSYTEDQL